MLSKCFAIDCLETVKGRMVIFGMQADNNNLCRQIEKEPSPAFSSIASHFLLSMHLIVFSFFHNEMQRLVKVVCIYLVYVQRLPLS